MLRAHNGIVHFSLVFFFCSPFFVARPDVISFHGELKVLKEHENAQLFIFAADGSARAHAFLEVVNFNDSFQPVSHLTQK